MKLSHAKLVKLAEKWLVNSKGCGFALSELRTINYEAPDSIGFKSGISILVEAKASRDDFHSDKHKIFRKNPDMGMGTFRFYLCPTGVIQPKDLPEKWGLIWVNDNGQCRQKVGPKGNIWNAHRSDFFFSKRNTEAEWNMMVSALRRLHLQGVLPKIYDTPWK